MKYYVLDENHEPVETDLIAASEWFGDLDNRSVSRTVTESGTIISTVFIMIDHGFSDADSPILFETAVETDDGWTIVSRYSTWVAAVTGHQLAVVDVLESEREAMHLLNKC